MLRSVLGKSSRREPIRRARPELIQSSDLRGRVRSPPPTPAGATTNTGTNTGTNTATSATAECRASTAASAGRARRSAAPRHPHRATGAERGGLGYWRTSRGGGQSSGGHVGHLSRAPGAVTGASAAVEPARFPVGSRASSSRSLSGHCGHGLWRKPADRTEIRVVRNRTGCHPDGAVTVDGIAGHDVDECFRGSAHGRTGQSRRLRVPHQTYPRSADNPSRRTSGSAGESSPRRSAIPHTSGRARRRSPLVDPATHRTS